MNDFSLKELQAIREALENAYGEHAKSAIEKIDAMLKAQGYVFSRKAFQSEWKYVIKK